MIDGRYLWFLFYDSNNKVIGTNFSLTNLAFRTLKEEVTVVRVKEK
jgi:hypothetical protein